MWRNPWLIGNSHFLPIYSGQKGCLNHWISWNRGILPQSENKALPPPSTLGDSSIDITPDDDQIA